MARDLIDREAALLALSRWALERPDWIDLQGARRAIRALPAVEPDYEAAAWDGPSPQAERITSSDVHDAVTRGRRDTPFGEDPTRYIVEAVMAKVRAKWGGKP